MSLYIILSIKFSCFSVDLNASESWCIGGCDCVFVLVVLDQREAVCYAEFHAGQCHKPLVGNYVLKADCCCSIGAAWADDCQFCPRPSTGLSLSLSLSPCLSVCLCGM